MAKVDYCKMNKITNIQPQQRRLKGLLTWSLQSSFLNAWRANPEILRTHLLSTWQLALDR